MCSSIKTRTHGIKLTYHCRARSNNGSMHDSCRARPGDGGVKGNRADRTLGKVAWIESRKHCLATRGRVIACHSFSSTAA